jgi:DNA-binding LacI/PurR family transcriptional regulator
MPMRSIHAGFVNGFGVGARDLKFEVIEGVGHYEELGKRAVEERLKRKKNIPDIIFSSNDYLALGAVAACQEAGLNIPEDAGIIGGTGLGLVNAGFHGLTRMAQPMERIGAELLNMLCRRIDNKGEDLPGIFLPIAFTGEATVRKEELEELTRVSYCNSEAQKGSGK